MIFPLLFNFSTHIKVFISGTGESLQLNLEGSRLAFVPSGLLPLGETNLLACSHCLWSLCLSPPENSPMFILATIQSWKNKVQILSPYWSNINFFCYNFMVFYFLLFSMYTERLWLLKLRKPDSMAGVCVYKK